MRRIGRGKRMKQNRIHHREHGCCCADSQPDGKYGEEGEGRRSAQAAQCELRGAKKVGNQPSSGRCDLVLSRGLHSASISVRAELACNKVLQTLVKICKEGP